MLGLGRRTFRRRYVHILFGVCLLCLLPPVHFAKVFPGHLVPSLSRYRRSSYSYDDTADSNSDSSRFLSPSSHTSALSSEKVLSPIQTSLIPFSYPYILQKSVYGNERVFRQLYNQDSPRREVPQAVVLDTEETFENPVYDSVLQDDEFIPTISLDTDQWAEPRELEDKPVIPAYSDHPEVSEIIYHQERPIEYYDYDSEEEELGDTIRNQEEEIIAEEQREHQKTTKDKPDRFYEEKSYHKSSSSNAQNQDRKTQTPCRYCRLREEDRNHRIESLKRKILQRLNMSTFPNRTGWHVPKALIHMAGIGPDLLRGHSLGSVHHQQYYDDDGGQEDFEDHSQPSRIIVLAKSLPVTFHSGEENITYFPMPASVLQSKVTKADLWFYVNQTGDDGSGIMQIQVDLLAPSLSKRRPHLSRIPVWKGLADPAKDNGWHRVDLTQVIQGWTQDPSSNHGLEIVAYNKKGSMVVLHPTSATDKGYEPTLDIVTSHDDSRHRHKRSDSLICTENSTEHRCCRYPLSLSFMDYQWDWVIAPTHMEVGYCSGECHMTLQNETPHSWLIAQARSSGSCCTPSKMVAMPLLYFNHEGDIVHQLLQDMRVERCGCA